MGILELSILNEFVKMPVSVFLVIGIKCLFMFLTMTISPCAIPWISSNL